MHYPGAQIYAFGDDKIEEVTVEETSHYQITKSFLNNPNKYFEEIFEDYDLQKLNKNQFLSNLNCLIIGILGQMCYF